MSSSDFTNPFRYAPVPEVVKAAKEVMARIAADPALEKAFSEGKMLGVLVVDGGYIAAFSGNVGGRSHIEGFVPPIYDLLAPEGKFKIKEAEISTLNQKITSLEQSADLATLKSQLIEYERDKNREIEILKARMAISKAERDQIRSEVSDPSRLAMLIRESQFEKAELRRLKLSWEEKIRILGAKLAEALSEIEDLKKTRARMSEELQDWIFRQYLVHNAMGEEATISDIFAAQGLVPPGGTGECAAPKLLEYAYRNGLKPIAMGEFWYGASPDTAVRTHGHFYPSCTSKCGPLLGFMLRGLRSESSSEGELTETCGQDGTLRVIFEDETMVIIDKPSEMPSVPGLNGRISAYEILKAKYPELYTVHRLDMDTSGLLIFAKTQKASVNLQKQFEEHKIKKTYKARLCASPDGKTLLPGDKGSIDLPLSPDYDERPRQKVDFPQGKASKTEYEVTAVNQDGTIDIIFRPYTGRTHQLRVHSAHHLGLGHPILGDLLYGGAFSSSASTLHLQAAAITFLHPSGNQELTIQI